MKSLSRGRSFIVFLFFYFIAHHLVAQNLVPNGGFENMYFCPYRYQFRPENFGPVDWSSATKGTPDHYSSCTVGEFSVPKNWAGVSKAKEGRSYVGIYGGECATQTRYREYLQCELKEPLRQGEEYTLEFHFRLSSYSMCAIDRMGAALSREKIFEDHDKTLSLPHQQIILDTTTLNYSWTKASFKITAQGNERFLIIGNFSPAEHTNFVPITNQELRDPQLEGVAYYYIDDVSLNAPKTIQPDSISEPVLTFETVVLFFEFDQSTITTDEQSKLTRLIKFLKKNNQSKIAISGYADHVGRPAYNIILSQKRAKRVADYLISQGVGQDRMIYQGLGEVPPAANTAEENSANRRVEIRLHHHL